MANDKINVNASLSALDTESSIEPYKFALSRNRIITFPNPEDLPWDKAEAFMSMLESGSNATISEVFGNWLTEEDFQKLSDENLSMRQVTALVKLVTEYYSDVFGTSPKG